MLTLPDFREKKIVLVQAEKDIDQQIRFWNSNVRLYKNGEFINQISCYLVLCIFIIGNTSITTTLIQKAKKYGISIFLLNYSFKQYAEILAAAEGNTALRRLQYISSTSHDLEQARLLVKNKLINQASLTKSGSNPLDTTGYEKALLKAQSIQDILGLEGRFASVYFQTIFERYGWHRRAPQAKEDTTNFLMDIGYSYLLNYVDAILRLFGFDTYKGFYHQLFFQRKSLSCDMVEVFRPIIDKAIIKGYNLGQIDAKDFVFKKGAFDFKPDPKLRSKYSLMFFSVITDYKEDVYSYLRQYYLHLLYPEKYKFPEWYLS